MVDQISTRNFWEFSGKSKLPPQIGSVVLRHHAEPSQLIFSECQMTGFNMTQDLAEKTSQKDLKITRTVRKKLKMC